MSALPPVPPAPVTIPKRRAGTAPLDHEVLFGAGLDHLKSISHRLWTDHNVHDPGITTLELLSYALTDLGYRASYSIPDLLASETDNEARMREQFFTAREILPVRPLTLSDYRKLLIDLEGVKNAWVRPATRTYFADTIRGELLREPAEGVTGVVPVEVRGLYDVLIEFMDEVNTAAERSGVLRRVRERLNANRNLCEDFVGIDTVGTEDFILCAELELAPDADVARVHAEMLFAVQEYLSPPVNQHPLAEMLARTAPDGMPYTADRIFEGPALEHGFIDDEELARAELRTEIRLSDVISIVMDVPGVRAVRDIVVSPRGAGAAVENRWQVPVTEGRKARLDRGRSRLVFYKRNMPFVARPEEVDAHWATLAAEATARVETDLREDFLIPLGRFRRPAEYYSFQNHFPAVYGVSEVGLVGGADERRRVLALQLKAYLLFFDQVMADFVAQLGRVSDLFSTDPSLEQTYFHQSVDSFVDHEKVYAVPDIVATLRDEVESREIGVERRNRFLDHLISRFGERFQDFAEIMRSEFAASPASMIRAKSDFLRDYPAISSERSLAYDYSLQGDDDLWNSENVSGLERRLARLLGIRRTSRRNLGEVSHDVYAEVDETPGDEFRFRVRHRETGKILLSSSTSYATPALAREEMRRAIAAASDPAGYQRRQGVDGRHYFNIVDETGAVVARRIEYFPTAGAMDAAIQRLTEYLRIQYGEEGMYLIESILLLPEEETDPFLPICPDPNCADCADQDPYSYRIHVILPAYAGRFDDMEFRRWAEQVIREETPAHIQPKICWISMDDMAELERLYRDWIYLRAGRETANRERKLTDFIRGLFRVKSVYPAQTLGACGPGEEREKFVLGRTALGSVE